MSFALLVLLAAWAINSAAHLIMAVLPILIGLVAVGALLSVGVAVWRRHDFW